MDYRVQKAAVIASNVMCVLETQTLSRLLAQLYYT